MRDILEIIVVLTFATLLLTPTPIPAQEPLKADQKSKLLADLQEDLLARQQALSNLTIKFDRTTNSPHFGEEHWTNEYFILGDSLQSIISCEKPLEDGRIVRLYSSSPNECFSLYKFQGGDGYVITNQGEPARAMINRHHLVRDMWLAQPGLRIPFFSVMEILSQPHESLTLSLKDGKPQIISKLSPWSVYVEIPLTTLSFSKRPYRLESATLTYNVNIDGNPSNSRSTLTFNYDEDDSSPTAKLVSAKWVDEGFSDGEAYQSITECKVIEYRLNKVTPKQFEISNFELSLQTPPSPSPK